VPAPAVATAIGARPRSRPPVVLVAFVGLAVALFHSGWSAPTERWIGQPGDPPLHMWFLRWAPWALFHGRNPLFTTHINYPDGVNLMWNTAEPLSGLVLAPLTFTAGTVFAYNVLFTLSLAASGWFAYLFLRRHTEHEVAAVVGGLLYGFSPYMVSQSLAHSHLAQAYVLPLLALVVEDIVRRRRSPWLNGALLGVLASIQLLVAEELVVYEAIAVVIALVVLGVVYWREAGRLAGDVARAALAGVLVLVLLAGVPLGFQFAGPERVTHGVLQPVEALSSDALSFVVPTELQAINPSWTRQVTSKFTDDCCHAEWGSYLGVPLLLVLVVSAVRYWRRPVVKAAGIVAGSFLVLSMGPHLHVDGTVTSARLPFYVLGQLPLVENVEPRRLMVVTFLAAAVLVAVLVDDIASRRRHPVVAVAGGLAVVVALAPLVPTTRFPSTRVEVPAFFTSAAVRQLPRGSTAFVVPFARNTSTSVPMLWQAEANFRFKMPDAYAVGPGKTGQMVFLPLTSEISDVVAALDGGHRLGRLTANDRARYGAYLARHRISSVVVGPQPNEPGWVGFFSDLLGRGPARVGGVDVWLHVDGQRVARGA
jgi:hypothetical protein